MSMKKTWKISFVTILLFSGSCVTQFVPKTTEDQELLVVEGLITDKPEVYTIKLSRPFHLGISNVSHPISGCDVTISDDLGDVYSFIETTPGTYTSNPTEFQGIIGRFYTLHINTNSTNNLLNYESFPVELKSVPPIDSLYYEKVTFQNGPDGSPSQEGCQIFLDTNDPKNECKYFRWEFIETWEFRLPYSVPNKVCWISNNSDVINIKNTSVISEDRVKRYPLTLISNVTDRLREEYSILVNQYSLNEDEYHYWEKLQNLSEQVGGLYDIIPSAIPSNIYCVDDPNQKVLGYFSVSASSSRRMFIKDRFAGVLTPYTDQTCIADTIYGNGPIAYLNSSVWVIINHPLPPPVYRVTTRIKACYDCTVRGTNIPPDFWPEDK
jgi:Domain of unknown function (DUF4249)